jgi:N-acetylglucosamine malate deacetylase 1
MMTPSRSVLAIFAHPDDIEFVAAGTLLRLKQVGWTIHYMNLANGCCGSTTTDREETARIRLAEAKSSAELLGAHFYPPICDDMDVAYNRANLAKVAAVVRQARPSVVLTHAPVDYMEDHTETCRLAVSAAFTKGIPNFATDPINPIFESEVALYHAQPHGNRTPLGKSVTPDWVVSIDSVIKQKTAMLHCHRSQQGWLQSTQKMNSYLETMLSLSRETAVLAGSKSEFAEGWRQHLHFGFGSPDFHPLSEVAIAVP